MCKTRKVTATAQQVHGQLALLFFASLLLFFLNGTSVAAAHHKENLRLNGVLTRLFSAALETDTP